MNKIFTTAVGLLLGLPLMAQTTFTDGDFTFVTTSDNTVELTASTITTGDLNIPETATNEGQQYTVTSIGESVWVRAQITSLTMPNTITRIGNQAFQFCMQLTSAQLSENLETIGTSAFQTTSKLTSINWPKTLKSIQNQAFWNSMGYTGQIWLPKGISVGQSAFKSMSKATSMWIDGQPSEWGSGVCESCDALKKLYVNCMYPPTFDPNDAFPEDDWGWGDPIEITLYVPVGAKANYEANELWGDFFVDIIEDDTMTNPDKTDPNGEPEIPSDREYETYENSWSEDFTSAKLNVAVPGSLEEMLGDHAYTLTSLALSGKLNGDDILILRELSGNGLDGSYIANAKLETLDLLNAEIVEGGGAYYSYTTVYHTENDVIGPKMFTHAYSLKNFVMPKYALAIGNEAFGNCASLENLSLNDYLESVGELAFSYTPLTSVVLPATCTTIGDMLFYDCEKLETAVLPEGIVSIPLATFYFCFNLKEFTIPSTVRNIDNMAFLNCESLTNLTIPAGTYSVSPYAFNGCTGLENIFVEAGNDSYADTDGVFMNRLKTNVIRYPQGKTQAEYAIPQGVTSIGEGAFYQAQFTDLTIPEGVAQLGQRAFNYCTKLQNVFIPSTLTDITEQFYGCGNLLNYNVAEGNSAYSDIEGVLCNANGSVLLDYPQGRTATSYTIPLGVETIGEESFTYNSALTDLTVTEGVETIESNAFAYCENLATLNLPTSLTLIEEGSFAYTSLTTVNCLATVPPTCEYFEDEYGVAYPFVGVETENCKLLVPEESVDLYKNAEVWSWFNVMANSSSIDSLNSESSAVSDIYTLDGRRNNNLVKGINIIRKADGKTQKVLVR